MARAMVWNRCSVDGCEKKSRSKGYCIGHYQRFWKYGDPLSGGTPRGVPLKFVNEIALPFCGDECLIWPYAKVKGYGVLSVNGQKVIASRYVCILVNGHAPTPYHEAAHLCGNGHIGCVNPSHIVWKTPVENSADRVVHGTMRQGEGHHCAKLTEMQVREILSMRGKRPQTAIAEQYGVSRSAISGIMCRTKWSSLSDEGQNARA